MRYRRTKIKGGTYFFTLNLAERKKTLLIDEIDKLRYTINKVKKRHPFKLDAMVILPDHLHALITMPMNDEDYPKRWRLIKSGFSRQLPKNERINNSRKTKNERGIWQRRYWEHYIRDNNDYQKHIAYIHYNPVKHGYVKQAKNWPYSTLHYYIANNIISADWGCFEKESNEIFGERE